MIKKIKEQDILLTNDQDNYLQTKDGKIYNYNEIIIINDKTEKENNYQNELISIKLERYIWEEIASACISVADFKMNNKYIRDILRKTYFQIKKEIR